MNTKPSGLRAAPPVLMILLAAASTPAHACATCGCSLSTDAAMGYSAEPGWRVNFEYDYIDQDQLRTGTQATTPAAAAAINASGGSQEVEHETVNRYTTLGLTYVPNPSWSVNLIVPYIDRSHSTYSNAVPSQLNGANLSSADAAGLGDIKVIGSYQGLLPTHNLGLQLGVKLPTGRYGGQNVVTGDFVGQDPVRFSSGPAAGQALDTSLNPGTGSTDLIVGAYYYQPVSQNFDAFASGQFQSAVAENLNQVNADFRPGNQTNITFGLRYEADPQLVPQIQINMTHRTADSGALADTLDTAGTVAYLSPGVTARVAARTSLYGFIQLPMYSNLRGYQLFPRWTASVGISYAF